MWNFGPRPNLIMSMAIEPEQTQNMETPGGFRPEWFCIRSHPKHEHIAAAHLGKLCDVEVFNPQLQLERVTRRGRVRCTESLFVNYLFARFELQQMLERVRHTPSVKNVVQFGQRFATIPDVVIEDLQMTLARYADTLFSDTPAEGDEVEVQAGPFQGEKAIVLKVLPARQRVQLLLDVMGRALPAEFSLSSIIFKRRPVAHRLFQAQTLEHSFETPALAGV